MKKVETSCGDDLYDTIREAVGKSIGTHQRVEFNFNDWHFVAEPTDSLPSALARFEKQTGYKPKTRDELAKEAGDRLDKMRDEQKAAIASAKVPTEAEMRNAEAEWPKSADELAKCIASLVDRPHDYGTCVYAMSLAAVATMHYVATALGCSGFQFGCADMDIIRRTRSMRHGFAIVDYARLLYPQYLDDERMPGWRAMLNDPEIRNGLREEAKKSLASKEHAHSNVVNHWIRVASEELF